MKDMPKEMPKRGPIDIVMDLGHMFIIAYYTIYTEVLQEK